MSEFHYTYIVILPETGEFYIGVRSSKCLPEDDPYKGSMCRWKVDKTKLVKGIFNIFDTREEANEDEECLINKYINESLNRNYHNVKNFCTKGLTHTEETKQKMSIKAKNRIYSEEELIKLKEFNRMYKLGSTSSNETKERCRIAALGKPKSIEHRKNISEGRKGMKFSEEHKKKLSIAAKSRTFSDETKQKLSISVKEACNKRKIK